VVGRVGGLSHAKKATITPTKRISFWSRIIPKSWGKKKDKEKKTKIV